MAVINTNTQGVTGGEVTLTTQKALTLYAISRSGSSKKFKLAIEVSPDAGTNWVTLPHLLTGVGCLHIDIVATKARIKVMEPEGVTSTVDAILLAR